MAKPGCERTQVRWPAVLWRDPPSLKTERGGGPQFSPARIVPEHIVLGGLGGQSTLLYSGVCSRDETPKSCTAVYHGASRQLWLGGLQPEGRHLLNPKALMGRPWVQFLGTNEKSSRARVDVPA